MEQYSELINIFLSYEIITPELIAEAQEYIENSVKKTQENQQLEKPSEPPKQISIEEALINLNYLTWEHIAAGHSQISGIPYVKLENYELNEELVAKIPKNLRDGILL